MSTILIENGVLLSPGAPRLTEHVGWVALEGDSIAALGQGTAPQEWRDRATRTIDARHMAVLPGLVNAHTHLSQTFLRGLADDRPLLRWLKEVIWPAQAAMTPEDQYLAALLGLVENLRCGAATVVQHHKLPGREFEEAVCRAAAQVGVRMVLARGWVDTGVYAEPLAGILDDLAWLHDAWHGGNRGRITVASGPMVPWRCSDEGMVQVTALARSWGAPTHIHVAETQDEIDLMHRRLGTGTGEGGHIEWLADLGCLGPDTQLVHTVHVTDRELDLISERGATVVHCPASNMYLASGAAPVRKMLDRGIPVRLGADGSGSNNSQDLLESAKLAALLAKHATANAQALLPADVVPMLTARRWLEAGGPADVTIVDLNNARCQPVHSVASALVYNANGADVHTVIVGGQILLDGGRVTTVDEAEVFDACRDAAAHLMERMGCPD